MIQPNEAFLDAMRDSARIIEFGGLKIGYVHVWCYAGRQYQNLLEELVSEGVLKDADALIWDLRDGWGGAQPDYLDIFAPGPTMTMEKPLRRPHLQRQMAPAGHGPGQWRHPQR